MYKTKNILKFAVSMLFVVATFTACVKDSDFDTPQVTCDDSFINTIPSNQIMSMSSLVSSYNGSALEIANVNAPDVYIKGYVTSSDFKGNFYKEVYIQDAISNPTAAIKIGIDKRSLYAKYPVGTLIYIKLNGLSVSDDNGTIAIGEILNGTFSNIREKVAEKNIMRSCEVKEITGIDINSTTDIDNSLLGKYVQFNNAEFDITIVGLPYVNPEDSYDSHRLIVLCNDESEIMLETSSFASFKDLPLPAEKFTISGILSRDYRDNFYVLKINDVSDIILDNSNRCGPDRLNCTDELVQTNTVLFFEDFESYASNATNIPGWTNININGGSRTFKVKYSQGNKSMEGSAYNSNENPLEMWLVSPAINLDSTTNEVLTFDTMAHHDNGRTLYVYVSTDFTGDVSTATWTYVDANLGRAYSSTYGDFINSGKINLSCLSGDVHIAFRYKGGDGVVTTSMRIDNVKVEGVQ